MSKQAKTDHLKPGIDRPLTLLIAALGGEGGGLLADWVIAAANSEGVLVQSTSIPGVAQRTGATTYYVEMMKPARSLKRSPVFGLYPAPGHVDIVTASELVEAGRAIENGFVSPDRTVLIASTHRVFSMQEKTAMGDGERPAKPIIDAANKLAKKPIVTDMAALCDAKGVMLNSVLLGAIAGCGLCPISNDAFRAAIRKSGVAVESNLRGFDIGLQHLDSGRIAPAGKSAAQSAANGNAARMLAFPEDVREFAGEGVRRLTVYQDRRYASHYLDRLEQVLAAENEAGTGRKGHELTREAARFLTLWMAYEDVIRVADLKTHPDRYANQYDEVKAKPGEPLRVTEFFKPGFDELTSILPASIGRAVLNWAAKKESRRKWHMAMHVRSDTIFGYLRLRLIARLKFMRRRSVRFRYEQAQIEQWLGYVVSGIAIDRKLGAEIIACARLVKGYSETRERGYRNLNAIYDGVIKPALDGRYKPAKAVKLLRQAREAAFQDEDGKNLTRLLEAA
ncbi:MAG: indolepyruvate oxidoreductase subunit beta family protein [Fimbriimonadaceae bacterium]|nr:indolepyruvate oxidoreductase subunit beta family protein [Alphaproteobacteria bacterium]